MFVVKNVGFIKRSLVWPFYIVAGVATHPILNFSKDIHAQSFQPVHAQGRDPAAAEADQRQRHADHRGKPHDHHQVDRDIEEYGHRQAGGGKLGEA